MELGVLGPVELTAGDERIALGGPKQRLVLGLLAARRGQVVPVDELIDGLWPEGPQARPRKTVQVYVTRLRRALGELADAIRSEASGYVLDPVLLPVDADAFEAGLRSATADRDHRSAVATLRSVLSRWRGEAFVDLRDCAALFPSAVQLDELRLVALHELFEREVQLRPREIIGELEEVVVANPLHEGFAAQLMTAQYRAGRQADALATYRTLRRRLADELGLEPGLALRELQGSILRHELSVAPPTATAVPLRQRRRVTVVAAELAIVSGDSPLDPEDELAIAAPLRRAARATIVEQGGLILAEAGDGLAACFGYPSSDRSVERAVTVALAIKELATGADPRVRVAVGVDTGVVVIEGPGERGTDALTGIAGEPLRAATRLREQAGSGEVLLGPATANAVAGVVELAETVGRQPGSGRPAMVAVRSGAAAPRRAVPSTGLIGRDSALSEVGAIATHADRRLCPVLVSGPAGIGKSALVDAFLAQLDESWSPVRLYCDARQASTLHPVREVLPALFADGAAPSARAIVQTLGDRWGTAIPILFVDDVEAADPSTFELLDGLPGQLANGLLILTARSTAPLELGGETVPQVVLGPLDRATSRQMAATIAGDRRLRLDTLNEIADRSGGVPLYIDVLTRAVIDRPTGSAIVPTSLYDSLMSVLDRLGPARPYAQRCSVLGTSFTLDDVDLVLPEGADPAETRRHLTTMVDADVLRLDGERFRFSNALVAETAYDSLLNTDRAELHARIADSAARAPTAVAPEQLAPHVAAAGRRFEAAVAWRRASAEAIRRARYREAEQHARRALRVLDGLTPDEQPDGGDTRQRALTNLAVGLQATSHGSHELRDVIAEARRWGADQHDLARRMTLDFADISNHHALGQFVEATDVAIAAVEAAQAAGDDLWSSFAHHFLGASLVWRGQLVAGEAELERSAQHWEAAGRPTLPRARIVGAIWAMRGLAACFADRPADADRLLVNAVIAVPAEDGYGRCLVATTRAVVDQLGGRPEVVRASVQPIWELAMDLSSDFWMGWAQVLLGWAIAAHEGGTGVAMMAEAIDHTSTRQAVPYFSLLLGARLGEHGRSRDGLARIDEGLAVADATGERVWSPLLLLERARWLAATGDHRAAEAAAADAAATAAATGHGLAMRRHVEWRASLDQEDGGGVA